MKLTVDEAIAELKKVDTIDMPARLCEAHYMAIEALKDEDDCKMALKALKQTVIYCKDCKYFEYDHVENIDGIPLIVGHEMCTRWGDGCKTNENGYCFLAEGSEME